MSDFDAKTHWEDIYKTKKPDKVSWFQDVPKTSIDYIEALQLKKNEAVIDVGGGDSFLVDYLLRNGYTDITVLDISKTAFDRAKERLGEEHAKKVTWIVCNIVDFTPNRTYSLWHDRAAFHFLTQAETIKTYARLACKAISVNGHLILGAFSTNGPKKCSGIAVRQYNEASLQRVFNKNFKQINIGYHNHTTPFNTTQNFIFCNFKKC
ncbi:class I SAM-dependent methyltransferase [Galbibacter sp. PAP.153]|uniref:class I SAM-dependent methyltransferase n=1 Tax=Galbibacter sp. PAP.153 TaxID=3104623 RepID=UPI00300B6A68